MDILLFLSLLILALPLLGFVVQMTFGRTRTPADYVIDPHENPAHHPGPHGNPADLHTAGDDAHYRLRATGPRAPWSDRDQRRAFRLSWISTAIMGACFLLALYLAVVTISAPMPKGVDVPNYFPKSQASAVWVDFADAVSSGIATAYTVSLGVLADNLSAIMLVVVTLVSLLVHLFSAEYMRQPSMHGGRFNRYYAFLGLFTFSMVGIVIANNLLMIYIFWELVGLSSYLLIGYWYERPGPGYASRKAFITNRVGDIGMFAGIMILYTEFGTFQLSAIFERIAAGALPFGSELWLTAAGLLLFCGAVGKSAQFPLNVWLPDAMEGPTPVSALIHAATMVAAGVYLVARIFPMLTADAMLVMAVVGAVTAFIAATMALVQWDLKKVLAFSTVSQLGYMVMALGVGAYEAAIFHLVTHAMFKACLFLGAGSVIHGMHGSLHHLHDHSRDPQDMRNMGGLRRKMPRTYLAMLAATLAISGVPLFSGYMSKDEILAGAWAFVNVSGMTVAGVILGVAYLTAAMTAFYMFRMIFLTFHGEPRERDIHENVRESRRIMTVPLLILAALALWIPFGLNPLDAPSGWFLGEWLQAPSSVLSRNYHDDPRLPRMEYRAGSSDGWDGQGSRYQFRLAEEMHHLHATGIPHIASLPALVSLLMAGAGIAGAFFLYGRGGARGQQASWDAPRGIRAFLFNRWYQDNLYEKIFPVGITLALSRLMAWFDQNVIDGIVNGVASATMGVSRVIAGFDIYVVDGLVNLVAGMAQFTGLMFRQAQTGRIQTYVVYVVLGVVVLFLVFR